MQKSLIVKIHWDVWHCRAETLLNKPTTSSVSFHLFFLIFRSIWTSAPGFPWHPESGRIPALSLWLFFFTPQQTATALRPNPYWSIMRSSWRELSEHNGCKDLPNLSVCLMKCYHVLLKPPNCYTCHRPGTCKICCHVNSMVNTRQTKGQEAFITIVTIIPCWLQGR